MTIRLFDPEAQARHREALEEHEAEIRRRREAGDFSSPWPEYPRPPAPMVDSRDEHLAGTSPFALGPMMPSGGVLADAIPVVRTLDRDGTAGCEPEGFKSEQAKPFKSSR